MTNLLVNLFIGLSIGGGVLVAQGLGAGNDAKVRQAVHTAIPVALISGVLVTIIGVILAPQFLDWMGTPPEIRALSAVYLRIYFAGMLFSMLYNYGAAILRAAGDTQSPLLYLTLAGVLNIVLNLFFVIVLHLDVAGVALATTISQVLSAVLVVRALIKRTDACCLELKKMAIHRGSLIKILQIGIPAGIQSSLFSISNVTIQSAINLFGKAAVAGNAASGSLEGFVWTAMSSFNQTALNFIGQNTGARNYDRVRKVFHYCLLWVTVIGLAMGGLILLFDEPLLSIFIADSPDALRYGVLRLSWICPLYFLAGIMDTATGALRGFGRSTSAMVITVVGVCVLRVGWILTIFQIPQFHNLPSLYLSYLVSWVLSFVVQAIVFYVALHKDKKKCSS